MCTCSLTHSLLPYKLSLYILEISKLQPKCKYHTGCELQCVGDNSCEGDPTDPRKIGYYNVKNSHGMSCSHDSCRTATYQLTSNVGGAVNCNGEESCLGADITINNLESVFCGGIKSCGESNMLIMNPQNYFYLSCTGLSKTHSTLISF